MLRPAPCGQRMMRLGQPRGLAPGLSLLALLASITTARGQNFASDFNVDGGAGSPSCPCIEAPQPPSASDAPCVDVSFVDPTTGVSQVCLSPSYGLGSCQAWDTGANSPLSECHSLAPPTYCSRRWCWVDANNCDRAFGLSSIEYMYPSLQSSSDLVPAGPDVGYSYTTCGNLDSCESRLRRANPLSAQPRHTVHTLETQNDRLVVLLPLWG